MLNLNLPLNFFGLVFVIVIELPEFIFFSHLVRFLLLLIELIRPVVERLVEYFGTGVVERSQERIHLLEPLLLHALLLQLLINRFDRFFAVPLEIQTFINYLLEFELLRRFYWLYGLKRVIPEYCVVNFFIVIIVLVLVTTRRL